MNDQGLDQPLTRREGLEILGMVQEVATAIRRLNQALFGEQEPTPEEREKDGLEGFADFGFKFSKAVQSTQGRIESLVKSLEGGESDGRK